MDTVLAIGIGVGLASIAGVRAFVPLVFALLVARLGYFDPSAAFQNVAGLETLRVIGPFLALALGEILLDKIKKVERVLNLFMTPVRAISGALLAAAVAPDASFVLFGIVGAVVAGAVAGLKVVLRPPARNASSGVSTSFLSLIEDIIGLIGGAIALFVPYLSVLLVAFLLFFFSRIRKRRGRKFGGLRILGD